MKRILTITLFLAAALSSEAQCAMCRATLENNLSNGDISLAAGLNTGILYLFFAPYLAVAALVYFWYRTSRPHGNEELPEGAAGR